MDAGVIAMHRMSLVTVLFASATAAAQTAPDQPAPAPPATLPTPTLPAATVAPYVPSNAQSFGDPASPTTATASTTAQPATDKPKSKEHQAGDFDAGGQLKLPSGPDETGKFATYNWIAVDAKGTYYVAPSVTANFLAPIAVHHPDMLMDGESPKMFGGFRAYLEAKLPKLPSMPGVPKNDTELGLGLTFGYMHDGAMLLSDKDYPLFVGNFHPGFKGELITRLKLSSLVDFSLVPAWVFQGGETESHAAVQVPMSLILKLGDLVQTAADLGVFTGDHYHFSGDAGGRIYAGGSLTVKIGPIQAHAGLGLASLLTGGLYPTIGDSVYVDLNVKYVK